tara:strand:+ start:146 stop:448 length:303 start_codon:yes stop_codon:yes gene_type:complete
MKDIGEFSIDNRGAGKGVTFTRGRITSGNYEQSSMNLDIEYAEFILGLQQWLRGALIQDVFPKASSEEREFIVSGLTPEAWNRIFGEEEYNDNELSEEPG